MSRDSACGLHWNILISAAPASLVALRWQMLIYAYSLPSAFVTSPWKYRSPLSSSRTRTPRESALVVTLPTIFRKAIRRALAAWRMRKIALQSTIARKKVSIRNWIGFLCTHISSQALFVGAKLWRFLPWFPRVSTVLCLRVACENNRANNHICAEADPPLKRTLMKRKLRGSKRYTNP